MELSNEEIQKDILEYRQRISLAESKLSLLSTGYLQYREHKKREKKKNDLLDDIKHMESLIRIAKSAIF